MMQVSSAHGTNGGGSAHAAPDVATANARPAARNGCPVDESRERQVPQRPASVPERPRPQSTEPPCHLEEQLAKRQRRSEDAKSDGVKTEDAKPEGEAILAETRAGVVDLVESDDEASSSSKKKTSKKKKDESDDESSSSSKKKKSKKDKKKTKKRELDLEKANKKMKKKQKRMLEEEKKEAKRQKKLDKKLQAEREATERARQAKKDQRLQEEREALERERQQRREASKAQRKREAEEEARCKADAAARRFAQRLDMYDTGAKSEANGKKEPAPLRPKKSPKEKAVSTSSPRLPTDPLTAASAADLVTHNEDAVHDAETPVAPEMPEQPVVSDGNDCDDGTAAGPSMADAIAGAHTSPNEEAEPTSCFASFESFDAQAAHSKAHPISAEKAREAAEKAAAKAAAKKKGIVKTQKVLLPEKFFSLQDLPEELKPESEFGDEPGIFVAHFVRWVLGAWQRSLRPGGELPTAGLTQDTVAIYKDKAKLLETSDAMAPLLRQLRRKEIHEELVTRLLGIVRLAANRAYASAIREYVDITMGKKTWHQSMSCMQMQQNHGGSIRVIIKQSPLLGFDWDPVVQAYIWALKRLIQFAQCIRPPEISSERA